MATAPSRGNWFVSFVLHWFCRFQLRSFKLMVMGFSWTLAYFRAFLGSVSDYCTHHAHCSVMIVKQNKPKKWWLPLPLSNRVIVCWAQCIHEQL
jgi:hypothetical protein